jgi:hypothetical protein
VTDRALCELPVHRLADLIARREVSSVEVIDAEVIP